MHAHRGAPFLVSYYIVHEGTYVRAYVMKWNVKFKKSSSNPVLSSNFWSRKPDNFDVEFNSSKYPNIKCFGFDKYINYLKDKDAIDWGNELAIKNHSKNLGISLHESVAYLGLCYKDLVVRLGIKNAKKEFERKGRNAFFPLTVMKRIIDDISPNLVITTNSPRSEAAAIEIANSHNIETLAMTDIFTGFSDYKIILKILDHAKKNKIIAGIQNGQPEYAEKMIKLGFQLVTIGSDQRYMTAASKAALSKLKKGAESDSGKGY